MSETSDEKRNERLGPILERNIKELAKRRRTEKEQRSSSERIADAVTAFTGSMTFVYIHLLVFGFWMAANLGWTDRLPPWDPSFVILAMVASVEAIFLSTFVLISQNRMMRDADRRADLDLQISLLTEHELSRVADVVVNLAARLGVPTDTAELEEVTHEIEPARVMDKIQERSDD